MSGLQSATPVQPDRANIAVHSESMFKGRLHIVIIALTLSTPAYYGSYRSHMSVQRMRVHKTILKVEVLEKDSSAGLNVVRH